MTTPTGGPAAPGPTSTPPTLAPTRARRTVVWVTFVLGVGLVAIGLLGVPWVQVQDRLLDFEAIRAGLERLRPRDPIPFSDMSYGYLVIGAYSWAFFSAVLVMLLPATQRAARIAAAVLSFIVAALTLTGLVAVLVSEGSASTSGRDVLVLSPLMVFGVLFVLVGCALLGGWTRPVAIITIVVLVTAATLHTASVLDFFSATGEQVHVFPTVAAPAVGYVLLAVGSALFRLGPQARPAP